MPRSVKKGPFVEHYLAKKMRVWAIEPDGTNLGLLAIDDWDFAWQEEYTFATPPRHVNEMEDLDGLSHWTSASEPW